MDLSLPGRSDRDEAWLWDLVLLGFHFPLAFPGLPFPKKTPFLTPSQAVAKASFSPFGLCHTGGADKVYIAPLGDTAKLPCPLLLWPGMVLTEMRWYRPTHPRGTQAVHVFRDRQDSDEDLMPEYKGRTTLMRDAHKGSYILQISNVRLEDRGLYQCQAWVGNSSREDNVTLQVAG